MKNLSPLDGRYREKVLPLSEYFSETALMKYRTMIEVEFFIALSLEPNFKEVKKFTKEEINSLRNLYLNFSQKDAEKIKTIEKTTNHDVKAVEYFIKEKLSQTSLKLLAGALSKSLQHDPPPLLLTYLHLNECCTRSLS